jgi:SH3 domain protein
LNQNPVFIMHFTCTLFPSRSTRMVFLFLLGALAWPLAAEEIRYVSDQVTLKMYKDPALSKALPPLKTGDQVVVIKHDDGYAQVRTKDDTTGWVKSALLSEEKPAVLRLQEIQRELDDLRSKHTDLLIEQPVAQPPPDKELMARVEAAESAQQNMKLRMKELEAQRMAYIEQLRGLEQKAQRESIWQDREILLWIILPVLTLISGFFIGFKYLEGKIKARFGGYNPL